MATDSETRVAVYSDKAPVPAPIFSQAIIANGLVFLSGGVALDPKTNKLMEGGTAGDRTKQIFRNIQVVLEEAGSSLKKVVKVNLYLTTMDIYKEVNEAYCTFFEAPMPARTCVEVKGLPLPTDIEIECVAKL